MVEQDTKKMVFSSLIWSTLYFVFFSGNRWLSCPSHYIAPRLQHRISPPSVSIHPNPTNVNLLFPPTTVPLRCTYVTTLSFRKKNFPLLFLPLFLHRQEKKGRKLGKSCSGTLKNIILWFSFRFLATRVILSKKKFFLLFFSNCAFFLHNLALNINNNTNNNLFTISRPLHVSHLVASVHVEVEVVVDVCDPELLPRLAVHPAAHLVEDVEVALLKIRESEIILFKCVDFFKKIQKVTCWKYLEK